MDLPAVAMRAPQLASPIGISGKVTSSTIAESAASSGAVVAGRTGAGYPAPGAQACTVATAQACRPGAPAWWTVWSLVAPVVW